MQKQLLALTLVTFTLLSLTYFLSTPTTVSPKSEFQEMADSINSNPESTWKADQHPKTDHIANLKRMFNLIIDTPPTEFDTQPITGLSSQDIPKNFDSRTNWPNCQSIREIRDQSGCGSCWAFGAASAMSDRLCVASKQTDQRRISSEDILECCTLCGMGCNGGFLYPTWYNWKRYGFVTGSLYQNKDWCKAYKFPPCNHHSDGPYEDCSKFHFNTPKCLKACSNDDYKTPYDSDKIFAESVYNVKGGEEAIQKELMTHGPVEAAFMVYADFLLYKSGVYQHSDGDFLGGHAIKIIGWGIENGVSFWTVVNSWNDSWGDQGTFKILRGVNHVGIEASVVAGIPKL